MSAPTALVRKPQQFAEAAINPVFVSDGQISNENTIDIMNSPATLMNSGLSQPTKFIDGRLSNVTSHATERSQLSFADRNDISLNSTIETRKVIIPAHRMAPLKIAWPSIYPPLVQQLNLQVRMNVKGKIVELRTSRKTADPGSLQKGEDFVKAFSLGFDVNDAIAILRLDDLYIETFEIKDVKTLNGEHLGRAIGRIAGKNGKTKFAIENASKTRIVLADQKIHILGGFKNINIAREAIVSLILGSPPGKVYGSLRTVAKRLKGRF